MNNKYLPVIIIGIVLVAAVIGGLALYGNQTGPVKPGATSPTPDKTKPDIKELLSKAPNAAGWSKGDPAAKVTLEEFADLACPTCAQFHVSLKEVEKTYGSRVRVIFHHFPLTIRGHENAYDAARATEAAGLQGRFWEMQNMLFTNQKNWQPLAGDGARKLFNDYAKSIGLDVERFNTDLVGQVATARVADDVKRAQAIKVDSTPTVILNGNRLLNINEITNLETLRQAIDAELQKAAPPAANNQNSSNQNSNK